MSSSTVKITSTDLRVTISALGAELQTLQTAAGQDLLWNGDPAFWTGRAPILFPIIGQLGGGVYRLDGHSTAMPKHGFARTSEFAVASASPGSAALRLSASAATRAVYPFEFALEITYTVTGCALTVTASITNEGAAAMPASFGFHPALRWPLPFGADRADHRLLFAQDEPAPIRRIDQHGLLLPEPRPSPVVGNRLDLHDALFTDDALIFDQLASRSLVYGADGAGQVRVDFAGFPALGVWTKPGAGFVCIEPWQGSSDPVRFNGDLRDKPGIVLIEPGARREFAMTISLVL